MLFPFARQSSPDASPGDSSDDRPPGMIDNPLGMWWRAGLRGRGFPYDPRLPVNFDSPGPPPAASVPPPATPAAAVPPAIVPQLVGRFTTRRTQLFGPFANLL